MFKFNYFSRPVLFAIFIGAGILYYIFKRKKSAETESSTPGHLKAGDTRTPFLNSYTTDFTALAKSGKIDPVIGRTDEVRRLVQVLSRQKKNNAMLIGDPGVGKTAIVEGLAERIISKEVPESLQNKRVLALDVATLMAGTKYRGEFEQRAKKVVQEISASNRSIILFIDEAHAIVQSQGSEGSINLSDILKPALARGDLQMIGATTPEEYTKYIKTDLSLERRFQPVEVREPSDAETLQMLQGAKDKYREYHKVEFTDAALETAVYLSKQLIVDRKLPDKAFDALDEAAAMVKIFHLHPAIHMVLYQTAVVAHPEVAALWKKIQETDKQIASLTDEPQKQKLTAERESLEKELEDKGIVTVDSADVEKVIREWA